MPNTYTQIFIQCVFTVQRRDMLIMPEWESRLYPYISGIISNNGHKVIAINGMPDHVHIFIGMKPHQSLSDLMSLVKGKSSSWVNDQKFVKCLFRWQSGYGGFSYGLSQIDRVVKYIQNQKKHHQKRNFMAEYEELLRKFHVEYDPMYIFKPVE